MNKLMGVLSIIILVVVGYAFYGGCINDIGQFFLGLLFGFGLYLAFTGLWARYKKNDTYTGAVVRIKE